ncbi:VOC family protein [Sphingobacterium spiritivorum]|uniref:VOC family protein n=1 Tax=Sphingobacterium spiritivorum TaxID=258 RepID=UPI003DA5874F
MSSNPVVYFEIPVLDLQRARIFYESVFGFEFEIDNIDNNEMAIFPFKEEEKGISGALAKGEIYQPSLAGILVYFYTQDITETLNTAVQNGAEILYPVTSNGQWGFVAEFKDSEGNRIGLHQALTHEG